MKRIADFARAQRVENLAAFVDELISNPTAEARDVLDFLIYVKESITVQFRACGPSVEQICNATNDNFTRLYVNRQVNGAPVDLSNLSLSQYFLLLRKLPAGAQGVVSLERIMCEGDALTIAEIILKFASDILRGDGIDAQNQDYSVELPVSPQCYEVLEANYLNANGICAFPICADPKQVFNILRPVMDLELLLSCMYRLNFITKFSIDPQHLVAVIENANIQMQTGTYIPVEVFWELFTSCDLSESIMESIVQIASFINPFASGSCYSMAKEAVIPLPRRTGKIPRDTMLQMYSVLLGNYKYYKHVVSQCSAELLLYLASNSLPAADFARILAQRAMQDGVSFVSDCLECLCSDFMAFPLEVVILTHKYVHSFVKVLKVGDKASKAKADELEAHLDQLQGLVAQQCNVSLDALSGVFNEELILRADSEAANAFISYLLDFGFPIEYSITLLGNALASPGEMRANQVLITKIFDIFSTELQFKRAKRLLSLIVGVMHRYGVLFSSCMADSQHSICCDVSWVAESWARLLTGLVSAGDWAREFLFKLRQKAEGAGQLLELPPEQQPKQPDTPSSAQSVDALITQTEIAFTEFKNLTLELTDCTEIKSKPFLHETICNVLEQLGVATPAHAHASVAEFDVPVKQLFVDACDQLLNVLNRIVPSNCYQLGYDLALKHEVSRIGVLNSIIRNQLFDSPAQTVWQLIKAFSGFDSQRLADYIAVCHIIPLLFVIYLQNMAVKCVLGQTNEKSSISAASLCNMQLGKFLEFSGFVLEYLPEDSLAWSDISATLIRIVRTQAECLNGLGLPHTAHWISSITQRVPHAKACISQAYFYLKRRYQEIVVVENQRIPDQDIAEMAFEQADIKQCETRLFDENFIEELHLPVFLNSGAAAAVRDRLSVVREEYFKELAVESDEEIADSLFAEWSVQLGRLPDVLIRILLPSEYSSWLFAAQVFSYVCEKAVAHGKAVEQRLTTAVHGYFKDECAKCLDHYSVDECYRRLDGFLGGMQ